jgi:hypothetical protein
MERLERAEMDRIFREGAEKDAPPSDEVQPSAGVVIKSLPDKTDHDAKTVMDPRSGRHRRLRRSLGDHHPGERRPAMEAVPGAHRRTFFRSNERSQNKTSKYIIIYL